ncbi:tetratricopeptide repeat protein [Pendulispora brunnea]|uniref:Tetratricopeptide repeat protein n=1 Tax=Pendulispora brunnea TaxID=2905690 RepID=A0ABZ2KN63_9BACT
MTHVRQVHRVTRLTMALCIALACSIFASQAHADHGTSITSAAEELVREAQAQEAAAEEQKALRLYTEALGIDPTCRDAYLGLAALRLRLGDAREAERVYSMSLEHVPDLHAALLGRARARRTIGKSPEAAVDLEAYASKEDNPRALRELARWYGEDGRLLAQLAVWRRLYILASTREDNALATEAKTMIRALQIMVHPMDPVTAPPAPAQMRTTIARIARRGG